MRSIYLDANVLIYAMESDTVPGRLARRWLEQIDRGSASGVTSALAALEVEPSAMRRGDTTLANAYRSIFEGRSSLRIAPMTSDILAKAIDLRATLGGQSVDSLHAATALIERCDAILTHDDGLRIPPGLTRLRMADVEPTAP